MRLGKLCRYGPARSTSSENGKQLFLKARHRICVKRRRRPLTAGHLHVLTLATIDGQQVMTRRMANVAALYTTAGTQPMWLASRVHHSQG